MKAIRGSRPLLVLALASLSTLIASCSERIIPPPRQTPTPQPVPPTPPPPPQPPRPVAQDWREAPITPGNWTWGIEGGQSVAHFAGGALTIRCDRSRRAITLQRETRTARPQQMTITTTHGVRTLAATPAGGSHIAVSLTPGDPVLDSMAFSRGRFAVDTPGAAPLYVPSWPEVSRVTEDCR